MTTQVYCRVCLLATFGVCSQAQTFDSGSTGADGSLTILTPGVTTFELSSSNDIYNFTTITIGPGVTLRLPRKKMQGPVFWLAQGDVHIDGTIELNGEDSTPYSSGAAREPTLGGAGGHGGGAGALNTNAAQGGSGAGGGDPGVGGTFTGNKLLVPLTGGSGGGGTDGSSGGGGGGALLIASSASITINGTISANGGNQSDPGFAATGGSGGGIRLVAPLITGSNALLAAKGGAANGGLSSGQDGKIRLEAFENDLRGTVNGTPLSIGEPFKLFLPPDPPPSIRVTSVAGSPVEASSGGALQLANVAVNTSDPVVIVLEAHYVQLGTIVKLHLYSDAGKDRTLEATPLAGTFNLSRATVTVPAISGITRVYVDAAWERVPKPKSAEKDHGTHSAIEAKAFAARP